MPEPTAAVIRVLTEETARRIAAGEVIDRPAAVLRELLDNALDAGATWIACHLEDGGNDRIRVVDNGAGIGPADLELCARPHATSKIRALEDLDRLSTLGFRGEALASIAACSRLEISSTPSHGNPASGRRLLIEGGKRVVLEEAPPRPGTIVDVSKIFFNMPARKRFLKRPQTEGMLCRTVFTEKALAFPAVTFQLFWDKAMILSLPSGGRCERLALAHDRVLRSELLEETAVDGDGFRITAVLARPELCRQDRKYLQVFVNRRRLYEFSLLQAVEYGYSGHLPGGLKPVAFVFIDIDPALVDFNIHPAKREARFRNLPALHHSLAALVQSWLAKTARPSAFPTAKRAPGDGAPSPSLFTGEESDKDPNVIGLYRTLKLEKEAADTAGRAVDASVPGLQYLGQLMRVYLAAATKDDLILVDQHAAHERLLYDDFLKQPRVRETLAVPIAFTPEEDELEALTKNKQAIVKAGFDLELTAQAVEVRSLPAALARVPEAEIIALLSNARGSYEEFERRTAALAACRAAVKEGAELDPVSGFELLRKALALPDPRCPHGRPVILRFSREALDKMFQRKI